MYMDKLRLDGRVAVVTGGGRAIGLACCQALAEAGARIVIADSDSIMTGSIVLADAGVVGEGACD
jgi:NAD(P)-dependent dehydrogenase (short-subunit alcohol dehydrogenase family)